MGKVVSGIVFTFLGIAFLAALIKQFAVPIATFVVLALVLRSL